MYRVQKNITINEDQQKFVKANIGKMNIAELSKMLGLTYNHVHKNLGLMGLTKKHKAPIVKMSKYFDVDEFGKYYQY